MIAVAHPGKIGDLLYAIPVVESLCKKHNCSTDFYTSEYCRPVIPLLEYQPYIEKVVIPEDYVLTGYGQGVQPWKMPVNGTHDHVYQMGVSGWPEVGMIEHYARKFEIAPSPFHFDCPPLDIGLGNQAYLVISVCRRTAGRYARAVIEEFGSTWPIIQLGGAGELPLLDGVYNDRPFDFLESASILNSAYLYAGGTGANSVLAIAFHNLPSVVAYAFMIDDRHLVPAPQVTYMREPSIDEYIETVRRRLG
jgi:hypothetical protein